MSKWRSSFEGFIASLESRSPHTLQSRVGVWELSVAINPYFKQESWYCLLKYLCFLDVEGSSSVSLMGLLPFARILSNDVCFVLICANLWFKFQHSFDRDATWKIKGK